FGADGWRRYRRGCKHVLTAAQTDHVAHDVAAIERVDRLAPDLIEHAHHRAIAVLRGQRRQAYALLRGHFTGLLFGAHQYTKTFNATRNVVELLRFAEVKRNTELAHVFELAF